ncbi:hypothetical protein [uncultured Kordia sp.]|uniref:hypothetical protein n=1 Tax=uncultured Kordia sp. TaxID=507699 RepID=UPI0026366D17|nr:hypothetical protein [uncultured Kordia sp.]
MRYVDLSKISIPKAWLTKAQKLQKELIGIKEIKDKLNHIDKNQIWNDKSLVKVLSDAMDGKCWYSEAKDLMSDRDVDHYRPKKEAKCIHRKKRDGYWFLAYDWENYRFSSIYSNRLRKDKFTKENVSFGKGSYFPLKASSTVALTKKQTEDESPYLLDPTKKYDASLISFNGFGNVVPSVPKSFIWDVLRVESSIKYYHLNHSPLKKARKKRWLACQIKINQIKKLCSDPDISSKDENTVETLKDELISWSQDTEILSGVVLACLERNKMTYILTV